MFGSNERVAVFSISLIFAFRMFGLFVMIPIFSPYLQGLNNATPFLIGLTMGIYGLTQALLQIPFGILSDFIGRREVITLGLAIFVLGCLVAASSDNIWLVMLGRALQGAGAISGTLIALVSDVTLETNRTKAMALVGVSIGSAFMLAFMFGPILNSFLSIANIFYLIALLAVPILFILWNIKLNKNNLKNNLNKTNLINFNNISKIFNSRDLLNQIALLSFCIFSLHGILTLNFIVIPLFFKTMINNSYQQGIYYLEIFILAIIFMLPLIIWSEKLKKQRLVMIIAVGCLVVSELMFWLLNNNFWSIMSGLVIFFIGFNILEASLPSIISKIAPEEIKGAIMGVYSTAQFLGPMVGGILAGVLFKYFGLVSVFVLGLVWSILWLYLLKFIKIHSYNLDISSADMDNKNYAGLVS